MGLATPNGLYSVLHEEALNTGLITKVYSLSEEPGFAYSAATNLRKQNGKVKG